MSNPNTTANTTDNTPPAVSITVFGRMLPYVRKWANRPLHYAYYYESDLRFKPLLRAWHYPWAPTWHIEVVLGTTCCNGEGSTLEAAEARLKTNLAKKLSDLNVLSSEL